MPNPTTLCISGQFDHIMADFISWLRHNAQNPIRTVALASHEYQEIPHIDWRLGSLISSEDTSGMLKDADFFLYFCLTPIHETRTDEGYATDVALTSAFNLTRQTRLNPDCHTILVTRSFPNDQRKFGKIYSLWQQIIRIFQDNCTSLTIIQTEPLISEWDALTIGMMEETCRHRFANHSLDPKWLNRTQPVERSGLFNAILQAIQTPQNQPIIVSGPSAVSYHLWHKMMATFLFPHLRFRTLDKITKKINPAKQLYHDLLYETLDFPTHSVHTTEDDQIFTESDLTLKSPFVQQHLKYLSQAEVMHDVVLKPVHAKSGQIFTKCYVQRILSHPTRDIDGIADLLMQWLPRYFQRLVQVDDLDNNRRICRLHRIPLVELEKKTESPTRCQLMMRNPWSDSLKPWTKLTVTQTGTESAPGELLVIIEDSRDGVFKMGFRAMLVAFGRYLKDYGIGS